MLSKISIKALYAPALAEGEGVGTAYEYFAKRLVLDKWLAQRPAPSSILIAGLPHKYGSSLDFLHLAEELGAEVTVVDERPQALEKLRRSLDAARAEGWLTGSEPELVSVSELTELMEISDQFDLVLASEVLQRVPSGSRPVYCRRLSQLTTAIALFAPNEDNPAHTNLSGLDGVSLAELRDLAIEAAGGSKHEGRVGETGYVDMPPFPPGMVRSEEQREQATSGNLEALAMWGLGYYARVEKWLPAGVRRRQSHIVFAIIG